MFAPFDTFFQADVSVRSNVIPNKIAVSSHSMAVYMTTNPLLKIRMFIFK